MSDLSSCFFFNDTATTEIYTLSLHDALPISIPLFSTVTGRSVEGPELGAAYWWDNMREPVRFAAAVDALLDARSEEHTSELQSRQYLVCRLLLEKKQKKQKQTHQVLNVVVTL